MNFKIHRMNMQAENKEANHIKKVYRKLFQKIHCKYKYKGWKDSVFKNLEKCHAIGQSKIYHHQIHNSQY